MRHMDILEGAFFKIVWLDFFGYGNEAWSIIAKTSSYPWLMEELK